ncbi:hypothetical protein QJS66_03480 [Kocuria rhizophila]|nr:hypothetical protein QJS66_03480 [Kocuria rhizophila]
MLLFLLSIIGSVHLFVGYSVGPHKQPSYDAVDTEPTSQLRLQNLLLGLGMAAGMFGIGIGVVHSTAP